MQQAKRTPQPRRENHDGRPPPPVREHGRTLRKDDQGGPDRGEHPQAGAAAAQADAQGLCEEGAIIIAEPVLELRTSDAPIRFQILEGVGQGEALSYVAEFKRLIVEDWHLLGGGGYVLRPRPKGGHGEGA